MQSVTVPCVVASILSPVLCAWIHKRVPLGNLLPFAANSLRKATTSGDLSGQILPPSTHAFVMSILLYSLCPNLCASVLASDSACLKRCAADASVLRSCNCSTGSLLEPTLEIGDFEMIAYFATPY